MGAAIAAGVPKPLAPSIRNINAQPTIISWATGFSLTPSSDLRKIAKAPVISMHLKRNIAPAIIESGVSASNAPLITLAFTNLASCLNINSTTI